VVVQRARDAGLAAIALTDHDTLGGLPEAIAAGERLGVRVVCGCEFSVRVSWGEMHLLGYFIPPSDPSIEAFLEKARKGRHERAIKMVEHLRAWGVDISDEDVFAEAAGAALGRPHVARALVRRGTVPDVQAAFEQFLGLGRRAYVEKVLPAFVEVAALVHAAGGVVSAAHLRDRGTRAVLTALKAEGLDAVEVRHPRHPPDVSAHLSDLASVLGLLRTGGTDWHGDEHDDGRTLGSSAVPLQWLASLESRVAGCERGTGERPEAL
jgi:predicted metal-dependent phosphoesterase TrpH